MKAKLFFDKDVILEHSGEFTWVYSPANHQWSRIKHHFCSILEQIIDDDGTIDSQRIKQRFERTTGDTMEERELESVIDGLLSGEVFFSSEREYDTSVRNFLRKGRVVGRAFQMVYLHLTLRCNFNCWYCYNKDLNARLHDELTTEQWTSIIRELTEMGTRTFVFTGGEPLLRADLEEALSLAKSKGARVELLTNGSLFTEERLLGILPLVDSIVLSLDGIDASMQELNRSNQGFDNILTLLQYFTGNKEAKDKLGIRTVVTNLNIESVMEFNRILRDCYGITRHVFVKYIPTTAEEVSLVPSGELLERSMLKCGDVPQINRPLPNFRNRCEAGTETIAVDPRGDLYPCQSLVGIGRFRMGSLLSPTWREDYQSSPVYHEFHELSVDNVPVCRECRFRYLCGGGCPALSWRLSNDIHHRVEYQCEYRQQEARIHIIHADNTVKPKTIPQGIPE